MNDPLSNGFASEPPESPPWPTTSHTAHPHPALIKPTSAAAESPTSGQYGREPQVYGRPEPGLISPEANKSSDGSKYEKDEPYLRVRLTGLDRNRRDILIRFDAQTNLPNFTGQTYRNVSRSYFEFQQFAEQVIYSNPQTIMPALPLAQTSAPSDEEDDRLVRIMLQRWLTRICEDPIILQDEELRAFIDSDFGYQPTIRPKRKASGGFSLIKRGVPDEDEELQRARFELTKLETQYFDTAKAVDRLARARKALAAVHSEMGNKLVNVAATEAHPPLASAMKKFGRTWHSLADLDQAEAISECVILGDSLGYQGLNAKSAKETLMQRTQVLEEHQAAVKATISKRRHIERLKSSANIRPDRVDEALEEMEEAQKYEQLLSRRVDGISQNLHRALHRHSRMSHEDINMALVEHARSTIMYERQLLRELESLRPEFNHAAKKAIIPPSKIHVPSVPITPPAPVSAVQARDQDALKYTPPQVPVIASAPEGASTLPASASIPPIPTSPPGAERFGDGTKSMFVKPSTDPLSAPSETQTLGRSTSASFLRPTTPGNANGRGGMHPLASSVRIETKHRRLDAREAAAKLANFL